MLGSGLPDLRGTHRIEGLRAAPAFAVYAASLAVTVVSTLPFSAAETGQFSFASSAAATNDSSVIPGTTPVTSSTDVVIPRRERT